MIRHVTFGYLIHDELLLLLLGRVALVAQRPIVVKLSRGRSVGLSVRTYVHVCVGRSVCPVHCGKTADRIRMPFGIIGRTGLWGMRHVVLFVDRSAGRGTFGGEFGARYCNQWGLYGVCVRQPATRSSSPITLGKLVSESLLNLGTRKN